MPHGYGVRTPDEQPEQPQYRPQVPPKRRNWTAILLIASSVGTLLCLAGVVVVFVAVSGSDDTDKTAAKPATLNQPVRDGQFEFTVTKVQCGVDKVGVAPLTRKPQGTFCLFTIGVKNVGKEPRLLSYTGQKAFDTKGAQYAADDAGLYVPDNDAVFATNINPGNAVTGVVVFDVPKSTKLATLELHDSMLSGGVAITVPAA